MTPEPYSFRGSRCSWSAPQRAAGSYWWSARTERPPWWRIALFALGLGLVVAAIASPLETIAASYLLLIHLLQNVMMADWAPPLLILGLTPAMRAAVSTCGGRVLRMLTRPRGRCRCGSSSGTGCTCRRSTTSRSGNPWALKRRARPAPRRRGSSSGGPCSPLEPHRPPTPAILAYLGIAFAISSFLGLAFIFSTTPFYDFYVEAPRLWGLSPEKDQNLGGILMNAEQTIVFLSALFYFILRLLDEEEGLSGRSRNASATARRGQGARSSAAAPRAAASPSA